MTRTRSFKELYLSILAEKKIPSCHEVTKFCRESNLLIRHAEKIPFDHWEHIALAMRGCLVADSQVLSMRLSLDDGMTNFSADADDTAPQRRHGQQRPQSAARRQNPSQQQRSSTSSASARQQSTTPSTAGSATDITQDEKRREQEPEEHDDVFDSVWQKIGEDLLRKRPAVLARVSCGFVQMISTSCHLSKLELAGIPFGDANICKMMSVFSDLSRGPFPQVETCVLAQVNMTDASVVTVIAALQRLPRLTAVSLAGNYITDESIDDVIKLLKPAPHIGRADRIWKNSVRTSALAVATTGDRHHSKARRGRSASSATNTHHATEEGTTSALVVASTSSPAAGGGGGTRTSPQSASASRVAPSSAAVVAGSIDIGRSQDETSSSSLRKLDLSFNEFSDVLLVKLADFFEENNNMIGDNDIGAGLDDEGLDEDESSSSAPGCLLEVLNLGGNHFREIGHLVDILPSVCCPYTLVRVQFSGLAAEQLPESIPKSRWTAEFDPDLLKLVFTAPPGLKPQVPPPRPRRASLLAAEQTSNKKQRSEKVIIPTYDRDGDVDGDAAVHQRRRDDVRYNSGNAKRRGTGGPASSANTQNTRGADDGGRSGKRDGSVSSSSPSAFNKAMQNAALRRQQYRDVLQQEALEKESDEDVDEFALHAEQQHGDDATTRGTERRPQPKKAERVVVRSNQQQQQRQKSNRADDDNDELPITMNALTMKEDTKIPRPSTAAATTEARAPKAPDAVPVVEANIRNDKSPADDENEAYAATAQCPAVKEEEEEEEVVPQEDQQPNEDFTNNGRDNNNTQAQKQQQRRSTAPRKTENQQPNDDEPCPAAASATAASSGVAGLQLERLLEQLDRSHELELATSRKQILELQQQLMDQQLCVEDQEQRFAALHEQLQFLMPRHQRTIVRTVKEPVVIFAPSPSSSPPLPQKKQQRQGGAAAGAGGCQEINPRVFAAAIRELMSDILSSHHQGGAAGEAAEKKLEQQLGVGGGAAGTADDMSDDDESVEAVHARLSELGW